MSEEKKGLDFGLNLNVCEQFTSKMGSTYYLLGKVGTSLVGALKPNLLLLPVSKHQSLLSLRVKLQCKGDASDGSCLESFAGYSNDTDRTSAMVIMPVGLLTGPLTHEHLRTIQQVMETGLHAICDRLSKAGVDVTGEAAVTGLFRNLLSEGLPESELKPLEPPAGPVLTAEAYANLHKQVVNALAPKEEATSEEEPKDSTEEGDSSTGGE